MKFEKLETKVLTPRDSYNALLSDATKTEIETFKNNEWVHDANDSDKPIATSSSNLLF